MPPNNRVTRMFGNVISQYTAETALDLGCGTGILTLIASRRCKEVTGVDINAKAVACARRNALQNGIRNVSFSIGDVFGPIHDQRFDLIFSNPPFYPIQGHEASKDTLTAIQENGLLKSFIVGARDHLKANGQALFVTSSLSNNDATAALLDQHNYWYSRRLLHAGTGTSQNIFLWEFQGKQCRHQNVAFCY